jgi:hypothetical protein
MVFMFLPSKLSSAAQIGGWCVPFILYYTTSIYYESLVQGDMGVVMTSYPKLTAGMNQSSKNLMQHPGQDLNQGLAQ